MGIEGRVAVRRSVVAVEDRGADDGVGETSRKTPSWGAERGSRSSVADGSMESQQGRSLLGRLGRSGGRPQGTSQLSKKRGESNRSQTMSRTKWVILGGAFLGLATCGLLFPCTLQIRDGEGWVRSANSLHQIGGKSHH